MSRVSELVRPFTWRILVANLGLAILYYVSAKLGLYFAYTPGMATLIWIPTGLSLGIVLLKGYAMLPGVALGAFITVLEARMPIWSTLLATAGNTLEAFLGAFLLTRFARFDRCLERLRDVSALLFWAALISTIPSATFGVGSMYLAGRITGVEFPEVWLIWWLGNLVSALWVAPLVLVWSRFPRWNWAQLGEFAMMIAMTGLTTLAAFGGIPFFAKTLPYPLVFLVSPMLIWAATRFEQHGVTITNLVIAIIAAWMTISERGPFAPFGTQESVALLWLFMVVNTITALFLAASTSQQRHAEESLRQAYAQIYQIINSPQGIAIQGYDQQGRVVFWNRASEELYGFSREQALGKRLGEFLLTPQDAQYFEQLLHQIATIGQPAPLREWNVKTPWGETRTVISSLFPTGAMVGNLRYICMDVDVTERKKLEAQLFRAQRLESIGRIAGGIAHDFKNLLTAISGYSELAQTRLPDDHPAQQDLQRIQEVVARAGQLIQHLLAFAKQQPLTPQYLDLNSLLQQAYPLLQQAAGRRVQIHLQLDHNLKMVLADPVQMEQVLLNLVINARDAMPEGGILTIGTQNLRVSEPLAEVPDMSPGEYVRLSVSDTGMGISPEHMEHLFEPFFTTKGEQGSGLGLSVVYGIVKQSGGFIQVNSIVGEGSAFHIYLPAVS